MSQVQHRWSYEEPPRMATRRVCLYCGLACRRPPGDAGSTWQSSRLEVRPHGGEWAAVPSLPQCTAVTQVSQYFRFLPGEEPVT